MVENIRILSASPTLASRNGSPEFETVYESGIWTSESDVGFEGATALTFLVLLIVLVMRAGDGNLAATLLETFVTANYLARRILCS